MDNDFHKKERSPLYLLINAINKRDPLMWFQCMASPVRNKLAKMNPTELQDYFNKQWSGFPFQITDYSSPGYGSGDITPAEYPAGSIIPKYSQELRVHWSNASEMGVAVVKERSGWWVLRLETFDLSISPKEISLTRAEDGRLLIAVKVHNNSNVSATDIDVKFFSGNPEEGGTLIDKTWIAIEPDSSNVETVPWYVEDGEYEVFVIVDPKDKIKEINEENNRASKVLKVRNSE